jgi:hypothetical protein
MSSTYSSSLRIELIGSGDQAGAWGTTTDNNLAYVLDTAIAGFQAVTVSSTSQALTYVNGPSTVSTLNQSVYAMLKFNSAGAASSIYAPPVSKQYIVWNNTSYTITIYNSTVIGNTTAAGTGISIASGDKIMVWSDGTNFYDLQAQNLTTTLAIAKGGTGQTTANAAFNALAPSQASANGKYLKSDGTNTAWDQIDISTADITGTLPVSNGGTGVTTSAAIVSLVGNVLFPVGAIYSSTSATNPGTSLGFGTWAAFGAGRVMIGAGTGGGGTYTAGATGGSKDAIVVSHNHTATSTDSGHTHAALSGALVQDGSNPSGGSTPYGPGNLGGRIPATATGNASITTTIATTGSSGTDANLPPYVVVYMWQRTA